MGFEELDHQIWILLGDAYGIIVFGLLLLS